MIEIKEILEKEGKIYAISEQSPFYPDYKGGQLGDRGKISEAKVLGVKEIDGRVYHELDRYIVPGKHNFEIDEEHRNFVKKQHTAQHILSAVFANVAEMNTVSFHMGFDYSTIDLDVPYIVENVLKEVEIEANKIIQKNIKVEEIIVSKKEVDKFPLRKNISEKVKDKVRIIKIGEYDYSACGGFHVRNTGEIGLVKILKTEKVKGNLTRVYFVAGLKALDYFYNYTKILRNISQILTSSIYKLEDRVGNLLVKIKELTARIENYSEQIAEEKMKEIKPLKNSVYFLEADDLVAKYMPKYFKKKDSLLIVFDGEKFYFTSTGDNYNVKQIIDKLKIKYPGRGGGSKIKGTFIPEEKLNVENILELLEV